MNDRGMIKWQPFNSVIATNYVLQELNEQKKKVNLPILSEEEKLNIENKLISAYYTKELVTITYYCNGYIKQIKNTIMKLNPLKKEIIFIDSFKLNFSQILKIN